MQLSDMRALLRKRIGNPTQSDVPDSVLSEKLNSAYLEIIDKYKFLRGRGRAKFTTTAGLDKYNISSITDVIYKVWDRTNNKELDKKTQNFSATNDADLIGGQAPIRGKPAVYLHYETYLQIMTLRGGAPDGAYSIEFLYKRTSDVLVDDDDVPAVPVTWHRGIVILASWHFYDDDAKDAAKAQYQKAAWKDWVSDKPVEAQEELQDVEDGVEVPTLSVSTTRTDRLDFDHRTE